MKIYLKHKTTLTSKQFRKENNNATTVINKDTTNGAVILLDICNSLLEQRRSKNDLQVKLKFTIGLIRTNASKKEEQENVPLIKESIVDKKEEMHQLRL